MCTPTDESYSVEQCEKDQKKVNCSDIPGVVSDFCLKTSVEDEDGRKSQQKACVSKAECEQTKANCDNAGKTEESKVKKCSVSCCSSDLCNNAFSVSINMMFIVTAALCSFKLF